MTRFALLLFRKQNMSISYPDLHADTASKHQEHVPYAQFVKYVPIVACESAPPQEQEETKKAAEMKQRHSTLCSLCKSPVKPHTLHCVLRCDHRAHLDCVNAGVARGDTKCEHCLEIDIAGLHSDITVDADRCMRILKEQSAKKFKTTDYDVVVSEHLLTEDDIQRMLGKKTVLPTSVIDIFWKKTEIDFEPRVEVYGESFIKAMRENNRSINDIMETMKYTIAHMWNAGLQTMDDLRAIGFDPAKHLRRPLRAVFPIHFMVERYNLDTKAFDTMTNEQIIDCDFDPNELVILGIDANFLTKRKFTAKQMAAAKSVTLDDWIGYAGFQVPHAIAMNMTAKEVEKNWKNEMQFGKRAHVFFIELHTKLGSV
jgi:hypothetical protein